jgi:hypothetical protein
MHQYRFDYLTRTWRGYSTAGMGCVAHSEFIDNHECSMEVTGGMDPDLEDFLHWMSAEGHLANLVVMTVGGLSDRDLPAHLDAALRLLGIK